MCSFRNYRLLKFWREKAFSTLILLLDSDIKHLKNYDGINASLFNYVICTFKECISKNWIFMCKKKIKAIKWINLEDSVNLTENPKCEEQTPLRVKNYISKPLQPIFLQIH